MADIIDTYIKKIDQYNINKKINIFFIYLRNKRDWLIKKTMVEIELFKIKLELKKNYTKLGKFIFKNYNEEDVVDFTYKEDFFILNQDIKRKKRYLKKIKNISK
tara:strand:- start:305 stop:616 length:312 start_codon:yes stop_codon:yes gene_type:complete